MLYTAPCSEADEVFLSGADRAKSFASRMKRSGARGSWLVAWQLPLNSHDQCTRACPAAGVALLTVAESAHCAFATHLSTAQPA